MQVRPGAPLMQVAQVTPQGNIVTQGLQLPPTARFITQQMGGPQIIGRLPLKPGTITAGKPGSGTVTLPIQVAVPAQGTLATLTSLPQSIIQATSLAATSITGSVVPGTVTVVTSGTHVNATDLGGIQTVHLTPTKSPMVGGAILTGSPVASAGALTATTSAGSNTASPASTPVQTPVKSDALSAPITTTVTVTAATAGTAAATGKKEVTKLITLSAADKKSLIVKESKFKVDVKPKSPGKVEKPESTQQKDATKSAEKEGAGGEKDGEKKEEKKDEKMEDDSFDAIKAMVWENGIGHLPGSDFKVINYAV